MSIRKKTVTLRGIKYPTVFVEGTETLNLEVSGMKIIISTRDLEEKDHKTISIEVVQGTEWIFDQPLAVEAHRNTFRLRKQPRKEEYCPICGNEEPKVTLSTPPNSKLLECPACRSTWYEGHGEKTPIGRDSALESVRRYNANAKVQE